MVGIVEFVILLLVLFASSAQVYVCHESPKIIAAQFPWLLCIQGTKYPTQPWKTLQPQLRDMIQALTVDCDFHIYLAPSQAPAQGFQLISLVKYC